ncbi:hypothetical protein MMC10_008231 [Thelotrema lepadinum]|nr:hypothetical protein [Thelotrema lepadinum]
MSLFRSLPSALSTRPLSRTSTAIRSRSFHSSSPRFVKVGDRLPNLAEALVESSPGNKVNLAEELGSGKSIVIGVPAAFSYISHPKLSSAGKVFVVAVNDAFV